MLPKRSSPHINEKYSAALVRKVESVDVVVDIVVVIVSE